MEPEVLNGLGKREAQVCREAARGLSNKEIAAVLGISEATVKVHMKRSLRQLGAHKRTELVSLFPDLYTHGGRDFIDLETPIWARPELGLSCAKVEDVVTNETERAVIELVTVGCTNAAISAATGLSEPLTKSIVRSLIMRSGTRNRTVLARWWLAQEAR